MPANGSTLFFEEADDDEDVFSSRLFVAFYSAFDSFIAFFQPGSAKQADAAIKTASAIFVFFDVFI